LGWDIHRSELNEAKVTEFKGSNPRFNALSRRQTSGSTPDGSAAFLALKELRRDPTASQMRDRHTIDIHNYPRRLE